MKVLAVAVLVLLFMASVALDRATRILPLKELRRRARSRHDRRAAMIYKLAAYEVSAEIFLWLVGSLSAAALVIMAGKRSWWAALLAALVISVVVALRSLPSRVGGWSWQLAGFIASPAAKLVSFVQPILQPLAHRIKNQREINRYTSTFEKEDLLEFISQQNQQTDTRIPEHEMQTAHSALTFSNKSVGSVMSPRKKVKMVVATESIGPLLMDELHASGLSRFPVVKEETKSASPEIVGTLYLKDLLDHQDSGKVKDVMKKEVYFINESQNLRQALAAFIKTQAHLLIVVNNFEELVGVIAIEDVVEQILGHKIDDDFDHYDDVKIVAGLAAVESQKGQNHNDNAVASGSE